MLLDKHAEVKPAWKKAARIGLSFHPGGTPKDSNDGDNDISKPRHIPNCALQLSIVLSRFSWNLLRICRLGEMRGTGADCCWTDSLSSFRSISALLRSGRHHHPLVRAGTGGNQCVRLIAWLLLEDTLLSPGGKKPQMSLVYPNNIIYLKAWADLAIRA